MPDKVSLDKNNGSSDVQLQTVNEKLDQILGEIAEIRREVNRLKSADEENLYQLDVKIRNVARNLTDEIYKIDRRMYSNHDELSRNFRKIDKRIDDNSALSVFIDKVLPWTPAILIGGAAWLLIIGAILD